MWQEVQDNKQWDDSVGRRPHASFLQSWFWGEFQQSLGRKVLRLSWQDEILAQVIQMNLPGGFSYWYLPYGPAVTRGAELSGEAWDGLVKMLGEHGAIFLRVDPAPELAALVRYGAGPVRQIPSAQPQCTLVLDLGLPAEQLLANMHQKTRYNINLATKKGVTVRPGTVDIFLQLNKQTVKRDKFVSHSDNYYRQMVHMFNPLLSEEGEGGGAAVKVWQAEFNNKVLASALIMYFGDTATYLHGASSNEYRQVKASPLLRWEIIKDAQRGGYRYCDNWGVNPEDTNHPAYKKSWEGITRFKSGFGGEVVCCPSSFDLIYRRGWYRLYRLLSRVRRFL